MARTPRPVWLDSREYTAVTLHLALLPVLGFELVLKRLPPDALKHVTSEMRAYNHKCYLSPQPRALGVPALHHEVPDTPVEDGIVVVAGGAVAAVQSI